MLQDHFWSRIIMDIGIQLKLFGRKFVRADSFIFFSRNKFFRTFFDRNLCQNYQHTIKILEIKKIYPVTWNLSQWQCYSNDIQSIFPTYIFTGELIQKHPRCAAEIKTTLTFYREPKTFSESEKTLQVTSNLRSWCQSGWKNISSRHEMILLLSDIYCCNNSENWYHRLHSFTDCHTFLFSVR